MKVRFDGSYFVEDRTKGPPGIFAAGQFVIWYEQQWPYPHRLYVGRFDSEASARAEVNRLIQEYDVGNRTPERSKVPDVPHDQ